MATMINNKTKKRKQMMSSIEKIYKKISHNKYNMISEKKQNRGIVCEFLVVQVTARWRDMRAAHWGTYIHACMHT